MGVYFEEQMKLHRWAYDGVMARQSTALQGRTFELLEAFQEQIHEELRILRQRVAAQARAAQAKTDDARMAVADLGAGSSGKTTLPPGIDYFQLERHFRGTEEEVRARQRFYLPLFQGRKNVLDIACGRGEFLELMRETEAGCRGVDLSPDMVGCCLEKGLDVVEAGSERKQGGNPASSQHTPARRLEHAGDNLQQRALAGAVRPDDAQNPAPFHIEADPFQRPELFVIGAPSEGKHFLQTRNRSRI